LADRYPFKAHLRQANRLRNCPLSGCRK
jgi:hypothetical protein